MNLRCFLRCREHGAHEIVCHYSEIVESESNSYEYQFYEVVKDIEDIDLQIKLLKEKLEELKEV